MSDARIQFLIEEAVAPLREEIRRLHEELHAAVNRPAPKTEEQPRTPVRRTVKD